MEYGYNIDVKNDNIDQLNSRPKIIMSGPPATAFLSCFPEVIVFNTSLNQDGEPLLHYALKESRLTTSYIIPICRPSSYSSDCIGVVECSSRCYNDLHIFITMNTALQVCMYFEHLVNLLQLTIYLKLIALVKKENSQLETYQRGIFITDQNNFISIKCPFLIRIHFRYSILVFHP